MNPNNSPIAAQKAAIVFPLIPAVPVPVVAPSAPVSVPLEYRANMSSLPAVDNKQTVMSPSNTIFYPSAPLSQSVNTIPFVPTYMASTSAPIPSIPANITGTYDHGIMKGKLHANVHAFLVQFVPEAVIPMVEYGTLIGTGVWLGGKIYRKFLHTWSKSRISK